MNWISSHIRSALALVLVVVITLGVAAGVHYWDTHPTPAPTDPVTLPDTINTTAGAVEIVAKAKAAKVHFVLPKGLTGRRTGAMSYLVWPDPAAQGTFIVQAFATVDSELAGAQTTVTFGTPTPPVPPIPPVPPVPPVPPQPPTPIPGPGLHVLIVYDEANTKLPPAQQDVIYGKAVRDYLQANCAAGDDGNKGYRIWPKIVTTTGEGKLWQDAFTRPRTTLPWIVIGNGTTGFEGPLPANVADTLALLKKYGG